MMVYDPIYDDLNTFFDYEIDSLTKIILLKFHVFDKKKFLIENIFLKKDTPCTDVTTTTATAEPTVDPTMYASMSTR